MRPTQTQNINISTRNKFSYWYFIKYLPLTCYFLGKILLCSHSHFQLPHPGEYSGGKKGNIHTNKYSRYKWCILSDFHAGFCELIFMLIKQCCDWFCWHYQKPQSSKSRKLMDWCNRLIYKYNTKGFIWQYPLCECK